MVSFLMVIFTQRHINVMCHDARKNDAYKLVMLGRVAHRFYCTVVFNIQGFIKFLRMLFLTLNLNISSSNLHFCLYVSCGMYSETCEQRPSWWSSEQQPLIRNIPSFGIVRYTYEKRPPLYKDHFWVHQGQSLITGFTVLLQLLVIWWLNNMVKHANYEWKVCL